jgi:hypothetical protein
MPEVRSLRSEVRKSVITRTAVMLNGVKYLAKADRSR